MSELTKTLFFVLSAVVLAAAAVIVDPSGYSPEVFNDQGEVFFAEFTDPQAPKTIEVIDYNDETATATPLKVEFTDNKWVIPSHHGYPADAQERLAQTAAALIELRKDRIVSDRVEDHAEYSVVDPLDESGTSLAGRGKRVTLRDGEDNVLADFIVGSAVEGKTGYHYMRVPTQKRTYEVKTEADISSNFEDWIETDLLKVTTADLRKIVINSYSINERLGRIENSSTVTLTHNDDEWKMGSRKPNADAISDLTAALDKLTIVDVQPKPAGLSADLKAKVGIKPTMENFRSLQGKGFFPNPYNGQLLSNEGEIVVDSKDGLQYTLRFGEIAAGGTGQEGSDDQTEADKGERRYVFIGVTYSAERAKRYEGDAEKGKELNDELRGRFAEWYYVISGADFAKLRPSSAELRRG